MTTDYGMWTKTEVMRYSKHYGLVWMLFGIGVSLSLQQILPLEGLQVLAPVIVCMTIMFASMWQCGRISKEKFKGVA